MSKNSEHPPYITVTRDMSGWFAMEVHYWEDGKGGFYEPYQTGIGKYRTREEAVEEGKAWAEAEGIEFRE